MLRNLCVRYPTLYVRTFASKVKQTTTQLIPSVSMQPSGAPSEQSFTHRKRASKSKSVLSGFELADPKFRLSADVPGVYIVGDSETAHKAIEVLNRHSEEPVCWHLEYSDVDSTRYTSFSKGKLVSMTAYVNNQIIFVDAWGDTASQTLPILKDYFESPDRPKVMHDSHTASHLLASHGIILKGLLANTRYLARLVDSSLASWEGKESTAKKQRDNATKEEDDIAKYTQTMFRNQQEELSPADEPNNLTISPDDELNTDTGYGLSELAKHFGIAFPRGFVNPSGNDVAVPVDAASAHLDRRFYQRYVQRCAGNAKLTSEVFNKLKKFLANLEWQSEVLPPDTDQLTLWDFAKYVFRPLAEYLVEIEKRGFAIDKEFLLKLKSKTVQENQNILKEFFDSASKIPQPVPLIVRQPGPKPTGQPTHASVDQSPLTYNQLLNPSYMLLNPKSTPMLRQLLFGQPQCHASNTVNNTKKKEVTSKKGKTDALDFPCEAVFSDEGKKSWFKVRGLGLIPLGDKKTKYFTKVGQAKVTHEVLTEFAGPDPLNGKFGAAYKQLEAKYGKVYAVETSKMINSITRLLKTGSTVNHVVEPILDRLCEDDSRLHCSLSLDTSTGRLVSRKPNLQNPPTNDLRKAFVAEKGKTLLVADYSQLELRILAHVSKCESMIRNLNSGADYHSQTAVDMFPEIRKKVQSGELSIGDIKTKHSVERAWAKTLNFSIVYGKSVRSLAEDLKVSVDEAGKLLKSWYDSKVEVRDWKQRVIAHAKESNIAYSLLGRPRYFPHILDPRLGKRSERAAVNHCIQGSAADLALCAMLRVRNDEVLNTLGFHMVLQVHDEFILEGPVENAEEAKTRLKTLMENPFEEINPKYKFKVPMIVDADIGLTWSDAKP